MSRPLVTVATYAYPEVSGEHRARLAQHVSEMESSSAFVLATCLRVEVAVLGDREAMAVELMSLFGEDHEVPGLVVREGLEGLVHLYRVAAGLESPVIGEPEILTQFRSALNADKATRDGLFLKMLEQAVPAAKEARDLLPFNPHESMASVAAQLVGAADQVAVFGSGVMATAVARATKLLPSPPSVTVVARHAERVTVSDVEVRTFDSAEQILATYPAVISATSAQTRLVAPTVLDGILRARRRELILVDMAMPPDFSPSKGTRVQYFDIDTLAARAARSVDTEKADERVEAVAAATYRRVADHREVGPLIQYLMGHADSLVEEVVERFRGRLTDAEDAALLRQTAHTVARALLAGPVAYLKEADNSTVDTMAEAFGFDE